MNALSDSQTLSSLVLFFASSMVVESFIFPNLLVQSPKPLSERKAFEADGPWAEFSLLPSIPSPAVDTGSEDHTKCPHHVTFASPLLDYGYPPTVEEFENGTLVEKPLLLYLPGFDGTYICPFIQFPELGTEFEVWSMTVGMKDRSTFSELKLSVLDFLENFDKPDITVPIEGDALPEDELLVNSTEPLEARNKRKAVQPFWSSWFSNEATSSVTDRRKARRPLYIAGESFGGILASEIALTLLECGADAAFDLKGLVLVNPATCYDRSQLAAKGPPVTRLPKALYPIGLSGLIPLFTDEYSFAQLLLILQAKALPSVIDDPMRESYMGRVAFSLPTKLEYMSQGTLTWRLEEWLEQGCEALETRIRDFRDYKSFRTLLLVGERDLTLPSIAEAERLVNLLPNSQVHVVDGAGHASTCGSRLDMTAQMRRAFTELRAPKGKSGKPDSKRTSMKPEASSGTGSYFGMEARYDGANIGLNPIRYWARSNYRGTKTAPFEYEVQGGEEGQTTTAYKRLKYQIKGK